jgi:sulfonate transport system substrate-binding protein
MMLTRRLFAGGLLLLPWGRAALSAAAADLPATIRFGDVGFGFGTPFGVGISAIADAKGFVAEEFKDTEVKLEFTYFTNTGPAINEAFANGQLDFAAYGAVPNVIGKANGLPTKIILSYGGTNIFGAARTDLSIKTVADLKGKRVAIQKATIIHWGLLHALQAYGLTENDITIVDLKNADQLAALAAKSVDAVFGASFVLPLRDKGLANIIYRSSDLGATATGFGAIVVTEEFAHKYPEATQRVARGFLKAAAWLARKENRAEAFSIWSRTGTPVALYQAEFEGQDLKEAFNPLLDDFFRSRYRSVIAFDREQKLIRTDVDLGKWIDGEIADKALGGLGLADFWPRRRDDGTAVK